MDNLFLRKIAALCVSHTSIYKKLPNIECWDQKRDAAKFSGGMPVVAHPPCRAWSAFTAHQTVDVEPEEMELGIHCCDMLKQNGGVLEQPAHSRLFQAGSLPEPGDAGSKDLFSLQVDQSWWGYALKKGTWLCFSGVDPEFIELVMPTNRTDIPESKKLWNTFSKHQRSTTTLWFAEWLCMVARASSKQQTTNNYAGAILQRKKFLGEIQ